MVVRPIALEFPTTRLVATLFYKSDSPHYFQHADLSPHKPDDQLPSASLESLKDGAAPTQDLAEYPLEPPTPGPSALDNLYGSCISQSCLSAFFSTLTGIIPGLSQSTITSKKMEETATCRVVEVTFPLPITTPVTLETLRRHDAMSRFEREWNVECVFQTDTLYRRYKRLAVFDMDSTLIQQEVIDEIASLIGVEDQVSAITAKAMNGELDFEASLRARCALLKGVPSTVFETLKPRITLNAGVEPLIKALKRLGFKTAGWGSSSASTTPLRTTSSSPKTERRSQASSGAKSCMRRRSESISLKSQRRRAYCWNRSLPLATAPTTCP
jgi:phosphoserine phosphatase